MKSNFVLSEITISHCRHGLLFITTNGEFSLSYGRIASGSEWESFGNNSRSDTGKIISASILWNNTQCQILHGYYFTTHPI